MKRRKLLVETVDLMVQRSAGVVVLIQTKMSNRPSYSALETLTLWATHLHAYLAPDVSAVRRMVSAREAGDEQRLIASAHIEDDKLVVWSCEPKRYEVLTSEVPALAHINREHIKEFKLNESGSRLHWEADDVDINLDVVRYYADPKVRQQQDRVTRGEVARYAEAIRTFRQAKGLTQANIPGITERQLRRIGQGESHPRTATLKKLAAAHGLSIEEYVAELAKRTRRRRVRRCPHEARARPERSGREGEGSAR